MTTEEKSLADREKMKFPLPGGVVETRTVVVAAATTEILVFVDDGFIVSVLFFFSSFFKEDRRIRQSLTLLPLLSRF